MLKKLLRNLTKKIEKKLFIYRYDLFAMSIMLIVITIFFDVLWNPGQIVFSDIDFPYDSRAYMHEIVGLWNNRWNTTSMLNIPRLFVVLPSLLLSFIFDFRGSMFLKSFIFQLLVTSAVSTYLLSKRLVSVYTGKQFDLPKILSLIFGCLLYTLNPYVVYRIQHIYLLVGYSLFPVVLLYFFKVFDHKFQRQMISGYSQYGGKIYRENYRDAFLLAYLITLASAAIHYFFYSVMALGILFMLLILKYSFMYSGRDRKKIIICMFMKLIVFGIIFMGFSFFWLSIYLGSIVVGAAASQHNINVIDTFTLFSRNSSWNEVLYMISYWWRMIPDTTFSLSFYVGGGILIGVIMFGMIYYGFRHHIILLVSILGGVMFFLATGVTYPILSKIFLVLCNLPFFGNVFRDPNKLVGLLALSYSILLIFGLEALVSLIKKNGSGRMLLTILFTVVGLSMVFYLLPMKTAFVNKYYAPIPQPEAYKELRAHYENSDVYGLYMPIAEQMLRPIHSISTPKWNNLGYEDQTKATGDVHIYNTPIRTVFHHEGNAPMITYYMNWLQWLMDQGRSQALGQYIKAFGVDDFLYHNEYIDQEARQQFNLNILELQKGLREYYKNDLFTVYEVEGNNEDTPARKIWTPYGLSKMETYQHLEGYDILEMPAVFLNQKNIPFDQEMISGDYIDTKDGMEVYLSTLDETYKVYPFEWVSELNPFLKWSKTYLKNPDWAWYMQQLDNVHKPFDLDQGHGVAVTFSSGRLDILPHERRFYEGELIMDFDTMLRTDSFFIAETPSIYDVQANPMKSLSSVGVVNGVISKGDPKDIWQVAKSQLIKANENTPYTYNILVSGRHTNKLHVKVRFFDKNREEIGIQYVTAPNESVDFEAINFYGEAISPKGTKYMRIDLLAFQRPEVKTYWWIHDINIYDYSAHKVKNEISHSVNIPASDYYEFYVRLFKSPKSGILGLTIDEETYVLDNKDTHYGFIWCPLTVEYLEAGEHQIALENIDGFNAVNQIAFVPKSQKGQLLLPTKKALLKANQLITLEGESALTYVGNIQSRSFYPQLSYGAGLSLDSGYGTTKIEILESKDYQIDLSMLFPFKENGRGRVILKKANGDVCLDEIVNQDVNRKIDLSKVVHYTPLDKNYNYTLLNSKNPLRYQNETFKKKLYLEAGWYVLEVQMESEVENLTTIEQLEKFDSNSLIVSSFLAAPYDQNCSPCESISDDMFRHELVEDVLRITYDATCSCDWYIYSSEKIPVTPLEELRVTYEARSEGIKNRHGKLIFIDEFDHIVDTAFIFEVEENEKPKWNRYEQLVTVPEGAKRVLLQFWARGDQDEEGFLELKELKLHRYDDYITLDYVIIEEIMNEEDTPKAPVDINQSGLMKMTVRKDSSESITWNSFLSPTPLWRDGNKTYDLAINGITMGYILTKEETVLEVVLNKVYYFGVGLHLLTLLLMVLYLIYFIKRSAYEKSANRR